MERLSLREQCNALNCRSISSVELTQHYFQRIKQFSALNAFISLDEEQAYHSAKKADQLIQTGRAKLLTGIPLAHKDIFCTQRMKTTCASKMLSNYQSPFPATIVKRLAEQGTVLLGKTNMDEFAMGSANESSYYGPVKNPWDLTKVAGGSSGGSAAAVAAGLVSFATGSDTGGSIRQPAAFCGISGMKPTYGLASRYGMVAFASSLDQAGPMARSAEDLAIILQAMLGFDPNDSTSIDRPVPNYQASLNAPIQSLRIGVPRCFFQSNVAPEIQEYIDSALKLYENAGARVIELDLSLQPLWVPCYYLLACAEASSNLSRYDGVRFGHRTSHANHLTEMIAQTREEGFGIEVKRRILTGTYVLSSGYFDAYYVQAQKVRRMIQTELKKAYQTVDLILGPTTPSLAFPLAKTSSNPTDRYQEDIFTVAANLGGFPAISIPAGLSHGLPIGMQLMGDFFSEAKLLSYAHFYQQQTSWHQTLPKAAET